MAISGSIEVEAYGNKITLPGKYMRLAECTIKNEYRWEVVKETVPGIDGVKETQKLVKVVEITGRLDIYNTAGDAAAGEAAAMSKTYTCPNGPLGTPVAQMYEYIMAQREIVGVAA